MANLNISAVCGVVVEEDIQFSLSELVKVCHTDVSKIIMLVEEGVLTPSGDQPQDWIFTGATLTRACSALRVTHGLELSAAGTALVLNLLDEIATLRSRLRRVGGYI